MKPFMFVTAASLVVTLLLAVTHAIPDEFDRFLHYRGVDATMDEILLDASGMTLSAEVWSAVCEIPRCVAFNNKGFLKAFPRNDSVDTYISKTHCGAQKKKKNELKVSQLNPRGGITSFHRPFLKKYFKTPLNPQILFTGFSTH